MTTYSAFVTAVSGLSVTGIKRQYDHVPNQVTTADLPASFVRLPSGGINYETLSTCSTSGNTRTCDLVVLVEAAGQGNPSPNYDATIAAIDNLESALRTAAEDATIMPFLEFAITSGAVGVGGSNYWGITATVTGSE